MVNLVDNVWEMQPTEKRVISAKRRFQRAVRLIGTLGIMEKEHKEEFKDIYNALEGKGKGGATVSKEEKGEENKID